MLSILEILLLIFYYYNFHTTEQLSIVKGLEKLHQITKIGLYSLRVDLEDFEENKVYAKYK